jgi:hypothetical protein
VFYSNNIALSREKKLRDKGSMLLLAKLRAGKDGVKFRNWIGI